MQNIRIRVAGIWVREGKILLVRHEKKGNSYWLLPGGGMEYGESAEEALKREFLEEVGLEVEVGPLVLVHDSIPPDRHRQVLNLYFWIAGSKGTLRVTQDGVLADAAYYPLEEFRTMKVNPDVKRELEEAMARHGQGGCRYLGNQWKD